MDKAEQKGKAEEDAASSQEQPGTSPCKESGQEGKGGEKEKRLKKKPLAWRITKRVLIAVFSLVVLISAVAAVVVNFVLTPGKVTPVLQRMANEYLDADVSIGKVDLTFFSSYPRVGVEVEKGLIVSHALRDSAFEKPDTLLRFEKCRLQVNLRAYLTRKMIVVRDLTIDSAQVYLFSSPDGVANYDIFLSSAETDTVADAADTASGPLFRGIGIRNLALNHSSVYFDDRSNRVYGRVEDADVKLRMGLGKRRSRLNLSFDSRNLLFWNDGELLVNKVSLKVKTGVEADHERKLYTLKGAGVRVNEVGFGAKGSFQADSLGRGLKVDVGFGLRTPSLRDVLSLIPESVMEKTDIDADGEVNLKGRLEGLYGKGSMPEARLSVNIENGKAHYAGMPYGIDTLTADFDAFVDLNKRKESYANLKILRLKALDVDVLARCRVFDLLDEPRVEFTSSTHVDMAVLSKIFPFKEGVGMGGKVDAEVEGKFRLADLMEKDYGRMAVKGNLDMHGLYLNDTAKDFYSHTDASFKFAGGKFLGGNFQVNRMSWKGRHLHAYVDSLRVRAITAPPKDSSAIARLGADISFKKLFAKLADTLYFFNLSTYAKATLKPHPDNPGTAFVNFDFQSDTLFARSGKNQARLRKAKVHLDLTRFRDTSWWPRAEVDFRRAVFRMDGISRPLRFNRLKASLDGDDIELQRANLRLGRSQLTLKGSAEDLWRVYKEGAKLRADLTIKSKMIDCNQLLNILSRPSDTAVDLETVSAAEEAREDALDEMDLSAEEADTLENMRLFLIPGNLDLRLRVDARKVFYDRMVFENIKGRVDVRNRALNLRRLDMRALDADMKMNLVYATRTPEKADVGVELDIRNIQLEKLVQFIPALDSALPMLRSFEGKVDVQTTASGELDSTMNILLPSLTAALRLHGEDMVLMDGETFAEISKILLFKNKERNLIDSISAVVTVQDGQVTVYPFMVEIDRYRVGVGGQQDLDMNFNYHISVLKSPIPFKLGINVRGNLDDIKIGLGKVLYKNSFTPAMTRQIDSARLDLGRQIVQQFEGWMERERRRIRRVDFPKMEVPSGPDSVVSTLSYRERRRRPVPGRKLPDSTAVHGAKPDRRQPVPGFVPSGRGSRPGADSGFLPGAVPAVKPDSALDSGPAGRRDGEV